MNRILKILFILGLCGIAFLTFTYASLMVAPGPLKSAHQSLNDDCFACHRPFRGVDSAKCSHCHQPSSIGRLTSKGLPIVKPSAMASLHKDLKGLDCAACHSDHAGVKPVAFAHNQFFVLDRDHSTACTTCHVANDYKKYTCYGCHEHTPAKIKREHLEEGILEFEKCVACHRSAEEKDD